MHGSPLVSAPSPLQVWVLTSCEGERSTHRDAVAEIASLYYSFAVDAISDIMSESLFQGFIKIQC